jgi:hypothetical protein
MVNLSGLSAVYPGYSQAMDDMVKRNYTKQLTDADRQRMYWEGQDRQALLDAASGQFGPQAVAEALARLQGQGQTPNGSNVGNIGQTGSGLGAIANGQNPPQPAAPALPNTTAQGFTSIQPYTGPQTAAAPNPNRPVVTIPRPAAPTIGQRADAGRAATNNQIGESYDTATAGGNDVAALYQQAQIADQRIRDELNTAPYTRDLSPMAKQMIYHQKLEELAKINPLIADMIRGDRDRAWFANQQIKNAHDADMETLRQAALLKSIAGGITGGGQIMWLNDQTPVIYNSKTGSLTDFATRKEITDPDVRAQVQATQGQHLDSTMLNTEMLAGSIYGWAEDANGFINELETTNFKVGAAGQVARAAQKLTAVFGSDQSANIFKTRLKKWAEEIEREMQQKHGYWSVAQEKAFKDLTNVDIGSNVQTVEDLIDMMMTSTYNRAGAILRQFPRSEVEYKPPKKKGGTAPNPGGGGATGDLSGKSDQDIKKALGLP